MNLEIIEDIKIHRINDIHLQELDIKLEGAIYKLEVLNLRGVEYKIHILEGVHENNKSSNGVMYIKDIEGKMQFTDNDTYDVNYNILKNIIQSNKQCDIDKISVENHIDILPYLDFSKLKNVKFIFDNNKYVHELVIISYCYNIIVVNPSNELYNFDTSEITCHIGKYLQ